LLRGIDQLIAKEVTVPVTIIDDPLTAVVRGTGVIAENIDAHAYLFVTSLKPLDITI